MSRNHHCTWFRENKKKSAMDVYNMAEKKAGSISRSEDEKLESNDKFTVFHRRAFFIKKDGSVSVGIRQLAIKSKAKSFAGAIQTPYASEWFSIPEDSDASLAQLVNKILSQKQG